MRTKGGNLIITLYALIDKIEREIAKTCISLLEVKNIWKIPLPASHQQLSK
jgi:hypothetical protein